MRINRSFVSIFLSFFVIETYATDAPQDFVDCEAYEQGSASDDIDPKQSVMRAFLGAVIEETKNQSVKDAALGMLAGCCIGICYGLYTSIAPIAIYCSSEDCDLGFVFCYLTKNAVLSGFLYSIFGPLLKPMWNSAYRAFINNDRDAFSRKIKKIVPQKRISD